MRLTAVVVAALLASCGGDSGSDGNPADQQQSESKGLWAGEVGTGGYMQGVLDEDGHFSGLLRLPGEEDEFQYFAISSGRRDHAVWQSRRLTQPYDGEREAYSWNSGFPAYGGGQVSFHGRQTAEGELTVDGEERPVTLVAKSPFAIGGGALDNSRWRARHNRVEAWTSNPDGTREPYWYRRETLTLEIGRGGQVTGSDVSVRQVPLSEDPDGQQIIHDKSFSGTISDSDISSDIRRFEITYKDSGEEREGFLYLYSTGFSNREMTILMDAGTPWRLFETAP